MNGPDTEMIIPSQLPGSPPGATPSGQLSDPFQRMRLASQQAFRAPVPLFSQAGHQQNPTAAPRPAPDTGIMCSQADMVTTQDLITPAEQFDLEYQPDAPGIRQRSPAQLSPNRIKRARHMVMSQTSQGTAGPGFAPGGTQQHQLGAPPRRMAIQRVRSPPCYRNMFLIENECEQDFAGWRGARPGSGNTFSRSRTDFKETGLLGQGKYSKVFRYRHRLDGKEYAVKRTIKEVSRESTDFLQFLQESQVLAHLPPHQNIVRYYASWTEAGNLGGELLFIQLERCSDSLEFLTNSTKNPIADRDLLQIAKQMAAALAHIHAHGVAHLDIKPANIFMLLPDSYEEPACGDGTSVGIPAGTVLKLGDFGQATTIDTWKQGAKQEACVNEGDDSYLPHEMIQGDYSKLDKVDMFMLGITLYELATRFPLDIKGVANEKLRRGKVGFMTSCSQFMGKIIKALMSENPDDRPSADKLLSMLMKREQHLSSQVTGVENVDGNVPCGGGMKD